LQTAVQVFEYVPVIAPVLGVPGAGFKFKEGDKGKGPFSETGMGYDQLRFIYDEGSEEQYVYIKAAFPPAPFPAPVTAVFFFYDVKRVKQFLRRAGKKA
jgi:hypothetical protein